MPEGDPKPDRTVLARNLTIVGMACAVAAFLLIDDATMQLMASIVGLALVLTGFEIRRRSQR